MLPTTQDVIFLIENPVEAESIAIGETVSRNLAAEKQTKNEMDDSTVDNVNSTLTMRCASYDSSLITRHFKDFLTGGAD